MSKMKHLLRKLHIGGGLNEHQRFGEARPTTNPSPSPTSSTPASSSSTSGGSATMGESGPSSRRMIGRLGMGAWISISWRRSFRCRWP
ncbi:hypothetical protein SLA2020_420780 [Shorea laevis]